MKDVKTKIVGTLFNCQNGKQMDLGDVADKIMPIIEKALTTQKELFIKIIEEGIKDACSDYCFVGDGRSDSSEEAMSMSEYIIEHLHKYGSKPLAELERRG